MNKWSVSAPCVPIYKLGLAGKAVLAICLWKYFGPIWGSLTVVRPSLGKGVLCWFWIMKIAQVVSEIHFGQYFGFSMHFRTPFCGQCVLCQWHTVWYIHYQHAIFQFPNEQYFKLEHTLWHHAYVSAICVYNHIVYVFIKLCLWSHRVTQLQYIPRNMHTVLLCFILLWLCNRS